MTPPAQLCKLLGIERPVLLAPMAGVSGGKLASAVSNAGGFGFVAGGYGDLTKLDAEMAHTSGSDVGIGLINWRINQSIVDSVLAYKPAALWLSFGDSSPFIPSAHNAGALVICQVFTVEEAVAMARAGADVIVAQGQESGGHGRSGHSLVDLVPAMAEALPDTPVVAAGGINDASDYEELTTLGAAGVALGTAFYATNEALDSDEAKRQLVASGGDDTVRGVVYDLIRGPEWPSDFDGRSLRTTLTEQWSGREDELRNNLNDEKARHQRAVTDNDMTVRVLWAGQGLDGVDAIRPAAEITRRFPRLGKTAN